MTDYVFYVDLCMLFLYITIYFLLYTLGKRMKKAEGIYKVFTQLYITLRDYIVLCIAAIYFQRHNYAYTFITHLHITHSICAILKNNSLIVTTSTKV